MTNELLIEVVGYIGSALVLVSFLMASVIKLRIINTIGSLICVIYSLIIAAYPTALMNACLVAINIYYLIQYMHNTTTYTIVKSTIDDSSVKYFIRLNHDDLITYFPNIDTLAIKDPVVLTIMNKNEMVGLFIGHQDGSTMDMDVDYTTKTYRDTSVGKQLYAYLQQQGYHELVYQGNVSKHVDYLKSMGFTHCDDGYIKTL